MSEPVGIVDALIWQRRRAQAAEAHVERLTTAAVTLLEVEAAYDRGLPAEHPLEIARRELLAVILAAGSGLDDDDDGKVSAGSEGE